jgi:hypothetical protein
MAVGIGVGWASSENRARVRWTQGLGGEPQAVGQLRRARPNPAPGVARSYITHLHFVMHRLRYIAPVCLSLLGVTTGDAQPASFQRLQATQTLRIDAVAESLVSVSAIAIGPDGRMIVGPGAGVSSAIRAFDATGRPLPFRLSTGTRDTNEIRWVSAMGWRGTTLFVIDPGFRHIALVDPSGRVTRSIELPEWIRPSWADRRKYPLFERIEPLGFYPDESVLGVPWAASSPIATPGYDSTKSIVARVAPNGSIVRTIATIPRSDGPEIAALRTQGTAPTTRFRGGRPWNASTDGARVAVVTTSPPVRDSVTLRLTVLSDRGDTVFVRSFATAAARIPKTILDSVTPALRRLGPVPTHFPVLAGVKVGHDHSVWIALAENAGKRRHVGFDARGEPIGMVELPAIFTVLAAERGQLWGFERNASGGGRAVVRYRVGR